MVVVAVVVEEAVVVEVVVEVVVVVVVSVVVRLIRFMVMVLEVQWLQDTPPRTPSQGRVVSIK